MGGLSSDMKLSPWQLQIAITGFCLSSIPDALIRSIDSENDDGSREKNATFERDGNVEDEDYDKSSIYSLLYALYSSTGTVLSDQGVPYQFTFNTWGFAPSRFAEEDPERYGKNAYAGLFDAEAVQAYIKKTVTPRIVEIGCGTGAGANLITREVVKSARYLAIDMQWAAIETCRERHATADNPGLKCVHSSGGIGVNGNQVRDEDDNVVPNHSVDFVVISETHIADVQVGPEEKAIFAEIHRILKPGGYFLWGNALPTRVWHEGYAYLSGTGFRRVSSVNHTDGAVKARDQDEPRVNVFANSMMDMYPAYSLPYYGAKCRAVTDRLLKNFYRHPGTALYFRMVTGHDSYMHETYEALPGSFS